jgi:putative ABC transport system permease protein
LTVRSFVTLTHVDLGFDPRNVFAVKLPSVPKAQYPTYDAQLAMTHRIVNALRGVPGVADAASTTVVPFKGGFIVATTIPGRSANEAVDGNSIAPGYFRVMRIPLLRGRDFTPHDDAHAQSVAIVNAAFAQHFFGTLDVIGRRIKPGLASNNTPSETRTIVGVVGNTRNHFSAPMLPEFYVPETQLETYGIVVVRTGGANFPVADAVKRTVAQVAPSLAAPQVYSYGDLFQQDAGRWQAAALLFGVLAGVALVLALAGIYAVTAYSVTQRTQEFGIRKAIGAKDGSVLGVVIGDALKQAAFGICIGLLLAAACTRLLEPLLFQTSPFDPLTYAAVIALLVACACCAALLPALRATRVQPATALRYE